MCGFLGEFSFEKKLSDSESFENLLSLSKHRGPDSTNITTGEKYRLGFNRLALLDLSTTGDQPKKSPSQRYHIVFNGEIYNYKELAEQYELQNLSSSSDTEVVLHLFDLLGIDKTIEQLNGMFAIAVIDTKTNELYLTRDFAGIKPLYYGINSKGVVFASQFDQIFKHFWFCDDLNLRPEIMLEYFAFGYMASPNTVYKDIFQVDPGSLLKIDAEGKIVNETIHQFPRQLIMDSGYELSELKNKIEKAVEIQLNSDRSLATFLSGGIDSSLITSYASKLKRNIEGFTLKVNDKKLNESEFAKTYAHSLNLKHRVIEVNENEILAMVDEHLDSFSEPFGDYSSIPTYLVTQKASQFHTSMLSGDGGDELFWGYPRMYDFLRKAQWFAMPLFIRKNIVRITNRLGITNTYAPFKKSLEEFWMDKHTKLPSEYLKSVFNTDYSIEMKTLYNLNKTGDKKQLQQFLRWNEFYGHLQRVLIKVDRTSMKNSLEVRVPFLDKNVINESWKMYFSINSLAKLKQPLKHLVHQTIPPNLLMQEKKGFSVPIEKWFRNQLKNDLIKTVIDSPLYGNAHFDEIKLKQYVKAFLEGKHNNGWGVWHIYAWQKWANKFILK